MAAGSARKSEYQCVWNWRSQRPRKCSTPVHFSRLRLVQAVIDSAESFGVKSMRAAGPSTRPLRQSLVVFSANHVNSVREGTSNLQEYIEKHPDSVRDVAYTMGVRRECLPYRSFAVSDGSAPLEFSAPSRTPSTIPAVTFVFTGQGAQWATMGTKLMSDFPSVHEDFQNLDGILSKLPQPPSWTVAGELSCQFLYIEIVNRSSR
jgi:acyl transferase domain-containing protein